jgi:hypothetical protein
VDDIDEALMSLNPQRLRAAAQQLHAKAGAPYRFQPVSHDPFTVSSMTEGLVAESDDAREQRERDFRTAQAKAEILRALDADKREAKQQQAKAHQEEYRAFRATPIGQLLGKGRYE